MSALAGAGWVVAALLGGWALLLRARLEAVARADHELRGPVTAIALSVAALARSPRPAERVAALEAQLARLRAGLADLAAARRRSPWRRRRPASAPALPLEAAVRAAADGWEPVAGALGRAIRLDWRASGAAAEIDPGRLAQALGNLLANALEHGSGDVAVEARRGGRGVRIEVRNRLGQVRGEPEGDRGRGLAIAERAAAEAGGRVALDRDGEHAVATLELPLAS